MLWPDGVSTAPRGRGVAVAKITGTVRRMSLEGGLWVLVGDDGEQYHLKDAPAGLRRDGMRAEVDGERPDGASIAMVGSILAVRSWRAL